MSARKKEEEKLELQIKAPNFRELVLQIKGMPGVPYVQNKFGTTAREKMKSNMENPMAKKRGAKREPRDFDLNFRESLRRSPEGWFGIHAGGLRAGMISACRTVGFTMTRAKLGFFIQADGFDADDGMPLVRIQGAEPERFDSLVKNETGVADIRARGRFVGWHARLRIRYDADMFAAQDIVNLLMRMGLQVGLGAGRYDSENSTGLGWGLFEIAGEIADKRISSPI